MSFLGPCLAHTHLLIVDLRQPAEMATQINLASSLPRGWGCWSGTHTVDLGRGVWMAGIECSPPCALESTLLIVEGPPPGGQHGVNEY